MSDRCTTVDRSDGTRPVGGRAGHLPPPREIAGRGRPHHHHDQHSASACSDGLSIHVDDRPGPPHRPPVAGPPRPARPATTQPHPRGDRDGPVARRGDAARRVPSARPCGSSGARWPATGTDPDRVIESDIDSIGLRAELTVEHDAAEFEGLVRGRPARPEEALRVYRGELAEGFAHECFARDRERLADAYEDALALAAPVAPRAAATSTGRARPRSSSWPATRCARKPTRRSSGSTGRADPVRRCCASSGASRPCSTARSARRRCRRPWRPTAQRWPRGRPIAAPGRRVELPAGPVLAFAARFLTLPRRTAGGGPAHSDTRTRPGSMTRVSSRLVGQRRSGRPDPQSAAVVTWILLAHSARLTRSAWRPPLWSSIVTTIQPRAGAVAELGEVDGDRQGGVVAMVEPDEVALRDARGGTDRSPATRSWSRRRTPRARTCRPRSRTARRPSVSPKSLAAAKMTIVEPLAGALTVQMSTRLPSTGRPRSRAPGR